jgi:predicted fused transcriptional regulator/phosphomethylpyrimidine kinase
MSVDESVRGALNLGTSDALLSAAREAGYDPFQFEAGYERRGQRLRDLFADRGRVPTVIYHEGTFGIPPITYVLGETATDATAVAIELVERANEA